MTHQARQGIFWEMVAGTRPIAPVSQMLGYTLLDVDEVVGTIRIGYTAKPEFANPMGNVQGGILTAMLDDTMGSLSVACLSEGQFAPTLELKTSFIAAARMGGFVGSGRVVNRGKSVLFLEAQLHDEKGKLVASATATAYIVKVA